MQHFHQVQKWRCWLIRRCTSNVKHSLADLVAERKIVIPRVQYKCVRVKDRKRGMDNCNRMCESAYREQVCTNVFVWCIWVWIPLGSGACCLSGWVALSSPNIYLTLCLTGLRTISQAWGIPAWTHTHTHTSSCLHPVVLGLYNILINCQTLNLIVYIYL